VPGCFEQGCSKVASKPPGRACAGSSPFSSRPSRMQFRIPGDPSRAITHFGANRFFIAATKASLKSLICFWSNRPTVLPARPISGRSHSGGSLPSDSKFLISPSSKFASTSLAASFANSSSVFAAAGMPIGTSATGTATGGTTTGVVVKVTRGAAGGLAGVCLLCARKPEISFLPHSWVVSASCRSNNDWLPREGLMPRRWTRTPSS